MIIAIATTANNQDENGKVIVGEAKDDPLYAGNRILAVKTGILPTTEANPLKDDQLLVVHDARKTLLYLFKKPVWRRWFDEGGYNMIWDVQLAEFMLSGQRDYEITVAGLAEKYGIASPDDTLEIYHKANVLPTDQAARLHVATHYRVISDVFEQQRSLIRSNGMSSLLRTQMRAIAASTLMAYNGMKFDIDLAKKERDEATVRCKEIEEILLTRMHAAMPDYPFEEMSLTKDALVRAYLFGGTVKYKGDVVKRDEEGEIVYYKTGLKAGQKKTRKESILIPVNGIRNSPVSLSDKGNVEVNKHVLAKLTTDEPDDFCTLLLEWRELHTSISTFYDGYAGHIHPDGCLHSTTHHCRAVTSRTSSSNPNLQNISNKEQDL